MLGRRACNASRGRRMNSAARSSPIPLHRSARARDSSGKEGGVVSEVRMETEAPTVPQTEGASAAKADREPRPEPAFYKRRRKRGNELCQILIRNGDVEPEHVRQGLKIQEERGGQIGRILVQMGACNEKAIARALIKQVQLNHAEGRKKSASIAARENPGI